VGVAISGIALISFGSLKLGDAIATRDLLVSEINGRDEVGSVAAQQALRYDERLASFKDDQLWGISSLSLGTLTLGLSVWLFLRADPHQEILDRARQQGDLDDGISLKSEPSWSVSPIVGGAQARFKLAF
jgi:hypothetical protein